MSNSNKQTMFTHIRKCLVALAIILVSFVSLASIAQASSKTVKLLLKPSQCVALRQGQECYADIELSWQANQGDYCLYSSQKPEPLACWKKSQRAIYSAEIVSKENVIFHLKNQNSSAVLAKAELEIAWVYKKNSRSHLSWRMF